MHHTRNFVLSLGAILLILSGYSLMNPYANIPMVSETVCSFRNGVWFDEPNAWYGAHRAGCYQPR